MDVFLQAKARKVESPTIAEAKGLLLAARMVSHLSLQDTIFFTDYQTLAKAATSSFLHHQLIPQKIRLRWTAPVHCRSSSLKNLSHWKTSQWYSSQLCLSGEAILFIAAYQFLQERSSQSIDCTVVQAAHVLNDHDYCRICGFRRTLVLPQG